jgi:hypothetical protein
VWTTAALYRTPRLACPSSGSAAIATVRPRIVVANKAVVKAESFEKEDIILSKCRTRRRDNALATVAGSTPGGPATTRPISVSSSEFLHECADVDIGCRDDNLVLSWRSPPQPVNVVKMRNPIGINFGPDLACRCDMGDVRRQPVKYRSPLTRRRAWLDYRSGYWVPKTRAVAPSAVSPLSSHEPPRRVRRYP